MILFYYGVTMKNKRKFIRFEPDENTYVLVDIQDEAIHSGLALSESQGGCCGVFKSNSLYKTGEMVYIKVGKMDPISAEIRWVKELDNDVMKLGFEYLS